MLKGLIIRYPNCIMDELEDAIKILEDRTVLTTVTLDDDLKEVSANFLLIPGGSCDLAVTNQGLHQLIKNVKDKNGTVAGICNGALVLASAGVLSGEKCTHTAVEKYAPRPQFDELLEVAAREFAGSEYIDEDVVVSNNVITAKPHATKEFAHAVEKALGI